MLAYWIPSSRLSKPASHHQIFSLSTNTSMLPNTSNSPSRSPHKHRHGLATSSV